MPELPKKQDFSWTKTREAILDGSDIVLRIRRLPWIILVVFGYLMLVCLYYTGNSIYHALSNTLVETRTFDVIFQAFGITTEYLFYIIPWVILILLALFFFTVPRQRKLLLAMKYLAWIYLVLLFASLVLSILDWFSTPPPEVVREFSAATIVFGSLWHLTLMAIMITAIVMSERMINEVESDDDR